MSTPVSANQPDQTNQSDQMPKLPLAWRVVGGVVLTGLLAVGFLGYFSPGMRLNWDAIAAMCGF